MSTFEPSTIIAILKNSIQDQTNKKGFEKKWNAAVNNRVEVWQKNRTTQASDPKQLRWEAHIVEYVNFIFKSTKVHGNAAKGTQPPTLAKDVPLLGPHFIPPTYLHLQKRSGAPDIEPDTVYLRPMNIIHPVYYPVLEDCTCPVCDSKNVRWDSWNGTGSREVHGVSCEEVALGYQLRCADCYLQQEPRTYCFATTNHVFWEKWEDNNVPCGIPYFFKRCALTRELFNLVIELRPSVTSAGLAENIKQLHLLEYRQRLLQYLQAFNSASKRERLQPIALKPFSEPWNERHNKVSASGYNDKSISDEIVTEVFVEYNERTRQAESEAYLKTLTAICLSFDHTFKAAAKAAILDTQRNSSKPMNGGVLSTINEGGETLAWRMCHTGAHAEIGELLAGIKKRFEELGVPMPEMAVVDNCCQVRREVVNCFPDIRVLLDVYHFLKRYLAVVVHGVKNPHRSMVAQDITGAILKTKANGSTPATYWPKDVQEVKLQAAYEKWGLKGSVWSAAASRVHDDGLKHVRKGCLARPREDIPSDGSRIEGSHKGWNNIQRSVASGIVMFCALSHDFVLRRNIRVGLSGRYRQPSKFLLSTHGSHHVKLVNDTAHLWNTLLEKQRSRGRGSDLQCLPEMRVVNSGERFGLVASEHAATFGGLFDVKKEEEPELLDLSTADADVVDDVLHDLNIDPTLLSKTATSSTTLLKTAQEPCIPSQAHMVPVSSKLSTHHQPAAQDHESDAMIVPTARDEVGLENGTLERQTSTIDLTIDSVESASPVPRYTSHPSKRKLSFDSGLMVPNKKPRQTEILEVSESAIVGTNTTASEPAVSALISTKQPSHPIHPFFATSTPSSGPGVAAANSNPIASDLTAQLPKPAASNGEKLTRSQVFYSVATNTDISSLSVGHGAEFFLFMNMRAEFQWVSYNMTSQKWASAAKEYNRRLVDLKISNSRAVYKNPRALMDKLGEIEPVVVSRIARKDYTSKTSKSDTFWTRHCGAVPITKLSNNVTEGAEIGKAKRKPQACTRCNTIMYPGPSGSVDNHKKGVCADGVKQKSDTEKLPEWPQPQGIFVKGREFRPIEFLKTLRTVYERIMPGGEPRTGEDIPMEFEAFCKLLRDRSTVLQDGSVLFKLFDLEMPATTPESLIVVHAGAKHLRLDCLREDSA